jgi:hypothetical protein
MTTIDTTPTSGAAAAARLREIARRIEDDPTLARAHVTYAIGVHCDTDAEYHAACAAIGDDLLDPECTVDGSTWRNLHIDGVCRYLSIFRPRQSDI